MAHIGSVFLGDTKRAHILSSGPSSPPSSPPPTSPGLSIMSGMMSGMSSPIPHSSPPHSASSDKQQHEAPPELSAPAPTIAPELSLELRLRWLEAIVFGVKQDKKGKAKLPADQTLVRTTDALQRRLDSVVEGNDGLKKFMRQYDKYAHLLTPTFALGGLLPDTPHEEMSDEALDALIAEMENDIRSADRDMREIEELVKKGATGAGKMADYEDLVPRLEALMKAHDEDLVQTTEIERRIAVLLDRHATQIDALSELFVAWDDTLTDAEAKVAKLERAKAERTRLGFEQ
ncbi:hypothetical protein CYLTODRAFT_494521 [Cylindrobasidium torrendii FP15055 ss-10]|uniref:Uncharacterized protein n=1 Tax=Cylindrobasidium torrendii FP15055 ss-10 TaxID=1314674 RepID=A0A0D7AWJ9_9AGAR|nr:hypothetical protein CYLTODRAFT_494521 [Cylindrobasidium torrendii FP15055 ss-10]